MFSVEFRRGVLFIRLKGRLNNEFYLTKINDIIREFGIRYVVLNLNRINNISLNNVEDIIKYNNILKKENKLLIICDTNNYRKRLFKDIPLRVSNEIDVFSFI